MKKNEVKTWGRVSFALSLAILSSTFLYALTPTKVPGELKDINATSKVWLSSNGLPFIFYTKDSNITKTISSSLKAVTSAKEIGLLINFRGKLNLQKDKNSSIDIKVSFSNEPISFAPNSSQNIGIEKKLVISKKTAQKHIDNNQTILNKEILTSINSTIKYAYDIKNRIKYPLNLDANRTLSIGLDQNKLYIIKSLEDNQTQTSISFSIKFKDDNRTILYQTKWIKLGDTISNPNTTTKKDIKKGREIFLQNCIACHRYDSDTTAPKGIAPMLTNVGGWANKEYLKDILLHPDKYQTQKYKQLESEGKIMPMPSFDWLSNEEIDNLLYFLEHLKL